MRILRWLIALVFALLVILGLAVGIAVGIQALLPLMTRIDDRWLKRLSLATIVLADRVTRVRYQELFFSALVLGAAIASERARRQGILVELAARLQWCSRVAWQQPWPRAV